MFNHFNSYFIISKYQDVFNYFHFIILSKKLEIAYIYIYNINNIKIWKKNNNLLYEYKFLYDLSLIP